MRVNFNSVKLHRLGFSSSTSRYKLEKQESPKGDDDLSYKEISPFKPHDGTLKSRLTYLYYPHEFVFAAIISLVPVLWLFEHPPHQVINALQEVSFNFNREDTFKRRILLDLAGLTILHPIINGLIVRLENKTKILSKMGFLSHGARAIPRIFVNTVAMLIQTFVLDYIIQRHSKPPEPVSVSDFSEFIQEKQKNINTDR